MLTKDHKKEIEKKVARHLAIACQEISEAILVADVDFYFRDIVRQMHDIQRRIYDVIGEKE